jgi:uncharacterized protein (DUF1015 family)
MAELRPFEGLRYTRPTADRMADVVAPPYDVISARQQASLHRRHPHNVVRLELGLAGTLDNPRDNPHTRAAAAFHAWQSEGILAADRPAALYLTEVDFEKGHRRHTRYGLIGRVRLEPFERGIVLPHERTFSAVKSERLGLMKACHANFSPIFALFPDRGGLFDTLCHLADTRPPDQDFHAADGQRHRLWKLSAQAVCRRVAEDLSGVPLFIADGHHRYETALAYRDALAERTPGFSPEHPANFVMMSLSSMADPGVVILPAHRLLHGLSDLQPEAFIRRAEAFFELRRFEAGPGRLPTAFAAALQGEPDGRHRLGVVLAADRTPWLLTLKPGVMAVRYGDEMAPALQALDVSVATRLVLRDLIGFSPQDLDDHERIDYASGLDEAYAAVCSGGCDLALMLNPTPIGQVRKVAEAGLIMPRKSTYFYPKVISGQVFYRLSA